MADNTVDTLSLEIKSSSIQAEKALDKLSISLLGVGKAVGRINTSGIKNFSNQIQDLSGNIEKVSKFKMPNLSGISKEFEKLKDIAIPKNINNTISSLARLANAGDKIGESAKNIPNLSEALKKSLGDIGGTEEVSKTINSFVSSFARLANAGEKSSIVANKLPKIGEALRSTIINIADAGSIDTDINRFVSSFARLANAGEKTGQVTSQLPALGKALRDVVNKMSGVGKISESVNLFVQSIAKLASAGSKTGQTAAGLQKLSEETLKFFQAMSKAPKISQNTIAMTQALAQLASAGGRVGVATGTITGAFNKLSGLGLKTANAIKKAAGTMVSSFKNIGSGSKHLNTASFGLSSLLKSALAFGAVRGIFNFGKEAITLGSDITEVENVVDTAFGSMANKAYEFASTATKQFGLSELAAKQYSGTMMAMLNSSGVAQGAAAEMSTTLAGLAGDLASFYNLDTDEAFRKIRSGISGEIEPLRQLGINMSVKLLLRLYIVICIESLRERKQKRCVA